MESAPPPDRSSESAAWCRSEPGRRAAGDRQQARPVAEPTTERRQGPPGQRPKEARGAGSWINSARMVGRQLAAHRTMPPTGCKENMNFNAAAESTVSRKDAKTQRRKGAKIDASQLPVIRECRFVFATLLTLREILHIRRAPLFFVPFRAGLRYTLRPMHRLARRRVLIRSTIDNPRNPPCRTRSANAIFSSAFWRLLASNSSRNCRNVRRGHQAMDRREEKRPGANPA